MPVFAGCDRPLSRDAGDGGTCPRQDRAGRDGPAGADVPLQAQHGVDFIVETLRARDAGDRDAVPAGPADQHRAWRCVKAPEHRRDASREIVLMGGGYFEVGNITPAAEFNIYVDPEAAPRCSRAACRS